VTAPPTFAVVGHPNKGKSSLVATLARDDRVRIAPEPGTTTRATAYPLRLDGETLYVLVDTPGFQRARAALAWMQAEAERTGASAAGRAAVVARFCETHPESDEAELLRPVLAGAGILYVVDGSVPYGSEYEAEMEILRWTGRPSLAVINPIARETADADHVEEWRQALGQYFKVVRVLDALGAPFDKRLDLLRAFGELEESWREPLARAIAALESDRALRRERAAREIAQLLSDAVNLSVEKRIAKNEAPDPYRAELAESYRSQLRRLERRCRRAVEAIYEFHDLDVEEPDDAEADTERALLAEDLFARQTWLVFGLRKGDLAAAGVAAGAAAGGAVDMALGGASLLAGTAIGGAIGGVLGWLGGERLARVQVLRQPLGGSLLRYGPSRSINLAAVLLGRALLHHAVVAGRSHARRDRLALDAAAARPALDARTTRRLVEPLQGAEGPAIEEIVPELSRLLAANT